MAKIEIEDSQLVFMKNRINEYEKIIRQHEEKINSLSEHELTKRAIRFSKTMCESYFNAVAKGLGFDSGVFNITESYKIENLMEQFGKDWWKSDQITATVSARVSKDFSDAYLTIGVIPPSERGKFKLSINSEL